MTEKKAARHRCSDNRAKANPTVHDNSIITDYNHGALIAGLIIAISFGLMFVHAAVML